MATRVNPLPQTDSAVASQLGLIPSHRSFRTILRIENAAITEVRHEDGLADADKQLPISSCR